MRELSIYYCSLCGFYGYFQLSKNAVCPKCKEKMLPLSMRYQEFMSLDCAERDELIARHLSTPSSLTERVTALHKTHNNREIIAHLYQEIEHLEKENKKLNGTVEWMHATIWELLGKTKQLEQQLSEYQK